MIDARTHERFQQAIKIARSNGLPLIEVLDRAGLLLTEQQRHNLEVTVLEDLYRRLDRQAPHKLLSYFYGRVEGTSAEMFEAMKMWVGTVCRNHANNTLEDL